MKSLLSAAALLAVIAAPALAEEATGTQAQPAAVVVEIVPTATEPAMTEAPATATGEDAQSKAAMGGHGCGAKKAVYLTN